MRVRNWHKFQSRKITKRPQWIKLHHILLDNMDWFLLPDRESKVLIGLWLLASEYGGGLPRVEEIAWRLHKPKDEIEDILENLVKAGFLDPTGGWATEKLDEIDDPEEVGPKYIPTKVRKAVFERDGNSCRVCGETEGLELDRIVPASQGGEATEDNLQVLCKSCSRRKRKQQNRPQPCDSPVYSPATEQPQPCATGTRSCLEVEKEVEVEEERDKEEEKETSSAPSDSKPFVSLPLKGGGAHDVTEDRIEYYERHYPGVDVRRELLAMEAWLDASPDRRKTARGIKRFITNWLGKEPDKAKPKQEPKPKLSMDYNKLLGFPPSEDMP